MGEFIHFRGKDAIIEAYERNGVPACSLCSGKDLLFCYDGGSIDEGAGLLSEFIDALKMGHSQGVYQLRMYKNPPHDINISTKQNFSFKCRILDPDEDLARTEQLSEGSYFKRENEALKGRIAALEAEEADDEIDEPIPAWQQAINGVLLRPDVQNFVMGKIFTFVEKMFGGSPVPQPAHTMNGVPEGAHPPSPPPGEQLTADQLYQQLPPAEREMLDAAMGILLANDPQIGTNLYKVASLLKSNPSKYRAFASMM